MEETDTIDRRVDAFVRATYLQNDPDAGLTESTHLVESGVIDSIRVLSLVEFMEEEFDIEIEPQDLFRLNSISEIASGIREKLAA